MSWMTEELGLLIKRKGENMKIQAISPFYTQSQNRTNSNNSNIAFYGRNFSNQELDGCLKNLELHRKIVQEAKNAIKIARETADENLQKVNGKINSEITDGDFLWAVTSDDSKRKWSRVIVELQYEHGDDKQTAWNFVITKIKESLTYEKPIKILGELEQAENNGLKPEHIPMFERLKSLITEKLNIEDAYRAKEAEISFDQFDKASQIPTRLGLKSLSSAETFERELKQRAIETRKYPEIKQIYSENYKERLSQILPLYKRGKAYQRASEYANSKVYDYLKYGKAEERPF